MDTKEMREKLAVLIKQAKEFADAGSIEDAQRVVAEYDDLAGKLAKAESTSVLTARIASEYEKAWTSPGPRAAVVATTGIPIDGDGGFGKGAEGFGNYLRSVAVSRLGRIDKRLQRIERIPEFAKDMAEGTGITGGFLVPNEYVANLLQLQGEGAIVRPRAYVQPMSRRTLTMPMLAIVPTAVPGGSGYFGGVIFEWTEESAHKPETQPYFEKLKLEAWKLAGYTKTEDELLEDSAIALGSLLGTLFNKGMIWQEDYAFLQGSGVAMPLGVINAPATIIVARTTAGAFVYQDAVNMFAHLLPGARPVWVMAQSVLPQLFTFQDPNGNYIWHPSFGIAGAASPAPGTLLGFPIILTEKLPTLGTQGDVLLADFSYYVIGDRKAITIAYSTEYLFPYDETAWRVLERVDGKPWMPTWMTLTDGTTVSPFVILGDAGS